MSDSSLVSLAAGSVARVVSVLPSGRLLVEVVVKGRGSWHRVGDCLVWLPGLVG